MKVKKREKSNNSENKKSITKFQSNFNTTSYAKKTTPKIDYKQQKIKSKR